ncbi:TPA: ATP-binding protein [Vibrio parahaemolyticus]|uniref:ATP-dependent nuclease n=2 Tax=Vibrio parahaemolyticus TaxID=670 RepID=UPI001123C23D|nr:ATP-binding protein [Vibrio parahaemolyticus]EGQ8069653.1 ATP-binding protein [Vibrio parahaemolyticus]EIU7055095.1 ATP-binding protein [Vibrio parahaemolyticus]EJE4708616.1 ATP-binding protein [Vibrio parahaemolyticus]MBE4478070.1 ATP-binding protein [Vibrio parahaemolyticus]MBM4811712.1 ATP-binding protein [Vibrio parahaemolyticus]
MRVTLTANTEYNGFLLEEPTVIDQKIAVLTGKNGSGKTRLIESIENGRTSILIDGLAVAKNDVRYVKHATLNPSFGANYNDLQHQGKVTAALQLYDNIKHDLDVPYESSKSNMYSKRNVNDSLTYKQLFDLCLYISDKIKKPASELSHEDIIFHYDEPLNNILGIQSISTIVNQYIKRLHQNEYNEWRSKEKGTEVSYFNKDEFLLKFGEKPWVLINRILMDTFDGKFEFSLPDESSKSYNYQATLTNVKDSSTVSISHLSSGEKTLLWLAITLFNAQYYDVDMANAPKVLLIDEPDAFLHPQMVLKMYKALESFGSNFNSIVILTTHSPTTVALSPSDQVLLVENNRITSIEKDEAIADLLDGVTQLSISPKNRRQVFVESQYDANVYQSIYSNLVHKSNKIDPKITISFVSSGPKMPKQHLIDKTKQILKISDENILKEYVEAINGVGNCVQVIGQVQALIENENTSVRGIVDWDLKNKPLDGISVLAEGEAYSIENITLDPICIQLLLHLDKNHTLQDICGSDVHWNEFLNSIELLQVCVDRFILHVLGRENKKDGRLRYTSGIELLTDLEYQNMNGHALERLIKEKYPDLLFYCRKGKDGELKESIVTKAMIKFTNGAFIPSVFEEVISEVQR